MGTSIYLSISKAVTPREWSEVYEESLRLAKELNLAMRRTVKIHGIDTVCLVPVGEYDGSYDRNHGDVRRLWSADGDYLSMCTGESFSMPRDLVRTENVDPEAGDAMLGSLSQCPEHPLDHAQNDTAYCLWGGKTLGKPYHMYLLAIACFIEAQLGTKAFVCGEITNEQCRRAVTIGNQFLKNPIDMPDCCCMNRFFHRVSALAFSEEEKFEIFRRFYVGKKGAEYGEFIRSVYSEEIVDKAWEAEFRKRKIGSIGFSQSFASYMRQGFDLEKLCRFVQFEEEEDEQPRQYDAFVRLVMDGGFHIEKKSCDDILAAEQKEKLLWGNDFLTGQCLCSSVGQAKNDRYIPLEEIRMALLMGIGEKCEVNRMIDEYLEKEKREGRPLPLGGRSCAESEQAARKRAYYDISRREDLQFYENGDTISPRIEKAIGKLRQFWDETLEEECYKRLAAGEPQRRKEWIGRLSRTLLLRDKDWERIFSDIETDDGSFARYYPMTRIKITDNIWEAVKALLINDDLYLYSKELANRYTESSRLR